MDILLIGVTAFLTSCAAAFISTSIAKRIKFEEQERTLERLESQKYRALDIEERFEFEHILNALYICNDCERFTRQHIMELQMLKDQLADGKKHRGKCPNCHSTNYSEARESFGWQKDHRHCFRLKESDYAGHKEIVARTKEQIKYNEDFKAFEQYETKHLANGRKEEPEELAEAIPEATRQFIQESNTFHVIGGELHVRRRDATGFIFENVKTKQQVHHAYMKGRIV